jgi:3-hydroxyisobutyrate dehydrogenase-like beta-hydroxyacid dehydrogenase
MNIGLLHPGEMGAAVGGCLVAVGHCVRWASAGRSPATAARAAAAGLTDAGSVTEVAGRSELILSICPPHAAVDVARSVAGFQGIFVDANAISPETARTIGPVIASGSFVDGGIVGPPPLAPGDTRLYLSGEHAAQVSDLFAGTAVDARVMPGTAGTASALKMAYAAWTKGTSALLLAVRALARAEDVEDVLLAEWALSQPGLPDRSERAARSAAAKGWRWIAEMEEIAATMTADGLPGGFHQAAAEVYRRSAPGDSSAGASPASKSPASKSPACESALDTILAALLTFRDGDKSVLSS